MLRLEPGLTAQVSSEAVKGQLGTLTLLNLKIVKLLEFISCATAPILNRDP